VARLHRKSRILQHSEHFGITGGNPCGAIGRRPHAFGNGRAVAKCGEYRIRILEKEQIAKVEHDRPATEVAFHKSAEMSFSMLEGLAVGAYRFLTLPWESTRNLVKFHLILSVPKTPRASRLRNV
jgi:hypothetical protein